MSAAEKSEIQIEIPENRILFKCLAPKSVASLNFEGTDFMRRDYCSMFCHLRFNRFLKEGDNVEIKVVFFSTPPVDGQCLLSITPSEFQNCKVKKIVKRNPYVIDPTTAWISNLKDDDYKKSMRFGVIYRNGSIQLRLPGETEFFTFFHVPQKDKEVCIDLFFCEFVKSVGLRTPLYPKLPENVDDVDVDDLVNDSALVDSFIQNKRSEVVVA